MKRYLLIFFVCLNLAAIAQTAIDSSVISGHWTLSGSPYIVNTDVYLPGGDTLIIDPGVEVKFTGLYEMIVNGRLYAVGTPEAPITFHAQDTAGWHDDSSPAGGWAGMHFQVYADTGSILQYCNISDCKYGRDTVDNSITSTTITSFRTLKLMYCNIFHNQAVSPLSNGVTMVNALYDGALTIGHCNIYNNTATFFIINCNGADNSKSAAFKNNEMYNNQAIEPIVFMNVSADIENNDFYNNTSVTSGGILNLEDNTIATVKGNRIHHNIMEREAAVMGVTSVADINGNLICNNYSNSSTTCGISDGGAAIHLTSNGTGTLDNFLIRNNVIANNRSEFVGAGICIKGANADIMNNTIVNNSAVTGGGIYIMNNSEPVHIKNNILYGNYSSSWANAWSLFVIGADQLSFDDNWTNYSYSQEVNNTALYTLVGDTLQNVSGTYAMLAAPTTAADYTEDATAADFSLQAGSPCINAGDSTGASSTGTDYAGNARIAGGRIDIGAYENTHAVASGLAQPHNSGNTVAVFPNPAQNSINVSLPVANGSVTVVDVTGKTVLQAMVTKKLLALDIGHVPAGSYLVNWIDAAGNISTVKITRQ